MNSVLQNLTNISNIQSQYVLPVIIGIVMILMVTIRSLLKPMPYKFTTKGPFLQWLLKRNPRITYGPFPDGYLEHELSSFEKSIHQVVKIRLNPKNIDKSEMLKFEIPHKEIIIRYLAIILPSEIGIDAVYNSLSSNNTWEESTRIGRLSPQEDKGDKTENTLTYNDFLEHKFNKIFYVDYLKYLQKIPTKFYTPLLLEFENQHICSVCQTNYRGNWPQPYGFTVYHRTITAFRSTEGQYKSFSLCHLHSHSWGPILLQETHGSNDLKAYYIS